ncbi:S6 family peptidase [Mixta intestinalis]|uniref:Serine protease pic autotransporter n=1 Tax=Mixta intestinalis TaxID=1615494 RepID=A0A6P1PUK6_9GAMM|nr:S6 family peptidase [Mixta intestinalis]QHM69821.1 Serine protease pic autotransporter [Mixta intestinalis]
MKYLLRRLCWGSALVSLTVNAAIFRHDIDTQDYRDFGENLGKYRPGAQFTPVYRKDNTLSGYLDFPMPDMGMVNSTGYATLISPSYIVGVRHNGGYKNSTWGNNAKYATTYTLINRNNDPAIDFHVPRLNKVVTDAAPTPYIGYSELSKEKNMSRFPWVVRVGAGKHGTINDDGSELLSLSAAYKWKAGGTISSDGMKINSMLRWAFWSPDSAFSSPLSLGTQGGDSGSPIFAYDSLDKQWKLVGVHVGTDGKGLYGRGFSAAMIKDSWINSVIAANSAPDVKDNVQHGDIHWNSSAITQGNSQWQWHGLEESYASRAPSAASNEALDATKDLRFDGDGGTIVLDRAINMGAGKLQFSADYQLRSAAGEDATWVGGGVEVDKDRTVLWQVNGLKGDALHKIGAGTLHINASGMNAGSLNVGDGTVILDQQADNAGNKQAFSTITLVSGRATVVLNSADQIGSDNIRFGYRGGTLDLNGNALSFSEIKHNDDGARIVNHNTSQAAQLTLTGRQQTFLGQLGEKESSGQLNLHYRPGKTSDSLTLAGGAILNDLTISQGTLQLSGQQVLHAGKIYYSDDWDDKAYNAGSLSVASGTALTVGEHGHLDTSATLERDATLKLYGHASLAGNIELTDESSELHADIAQRTSTQGALTSRIDATVNGKGWLKKTGDGLLILNGNINTEGGVALDAGELEVNGRMQSTLWMADRTQLSGSGQLGSLMMGKDAFLQPGKSDKPDEWSTLRIGQLTAGLNNNLLLDSAFSANATDRLLINGDLQTERDNPVLVSVNAKAAWTDSDSNADGIAGNREGVSVVQVSGKASADSVKLAGGYVARGAWAWGLYAFAPGKASGDERLVEGTGNQFWDYRLQNIMLAENDNHTPSPEQVTPQPEENHPPVPPSSGADNQPGNNPPARPQPDNTRPSTGSKPQMRPAVIPQVPAYISMPTAFLRYAENIQSLMSSSVAASASGFFLSGYKGNDDYHSPGSFSNYGYDFDSRYHGWLMGGRWQIIDDSQQSATFSLGVAKGQLKLTPRARDGSSQGQFDTLSLNGLLSWENEKGFNLSLPLGYHRYHGSVSTTLRGKVASPRANGWHLGLEAGKTWLAGSHQLTPLAGIRYQRLSLDTFTDNDDALVSWKMHSMPQFFTGMKYQYQLDFAQYGQLRLGSDLRLIHRPGHANETIISDGVQPAVFASGQGGDSLQISTDIGLRLKENLEVTSKLQHQRRLSKEGMEDWGIIGGVNVTF